MIVKNIRLYTIMNSIGTSAVEVCMTSTSGNHAIASAPSALLAGKREIHATEAIENVLTNQLINELVNRELNQYLLDSILNNYLDLLGSDVCLSMSLAFARLSAKDTCQSLVQYIRTQLPYIVENKFPKPMVTVFSGGVHSKKHKSIQNIMLCADGSSFRDSASMTSDVYSTIEAYLDKHNLLQGYGKSSGMISDSLTILQKLDLVTDAISKSNNPEKLSIAIDIAAEHLWESNVKKYSCEGMVLSGKELLSMLQRYIEKYPITFIEDPLDSSEEKLWMEFLRRNSDICIAGDDLFATQCQFLDNSLANGIIIKMNQAGTLTNTLNTVSKSHSLGMITCVSHRSVETEDTFMCDLSVAICSDYIKIGGPRRGDRTIKYNRLFRLEGKGVS